LVWFPSYTLSSANKRPPTNHQKHSRQFIPGQNSGSGNEQFHQLWFDASERYAVYTFKWMYGQIDWFVDGKLVRSSQFNPSRPMPLQSYSTCRVLANIWVVDKQTESWGGAVSPDFTAAQSSYRWIRFDEGDQCNAPTSC
jgi:beta-glucanase (GH16 family)